MTLNYFEPSTLVQQDATFNYRAKSGAGFGILPSNEQVFISARMVEENDLKIGDAVRVWAVDNLASPETAHFSSRWRAVRLQVTARLEDIIKNIPSPPPAPAPTPAVSDFSGVMDMLLAERRPWTINELTHAIAKASIPLSALPDLIQKVGTRLAALHKTGDAACLRVYAKADNDRASAVYFAKDVDVFYDHLDTPLGEENE
jgi:hypothetical protein